MFLTAQTGMLGPFAWVLGKLLNLIYNLLCDGNGIANIGICIIIFTIVVKIIILPLNIKQQKSAKINMIIQPEIQKVQKKYKDKKDQDSMLKQQKEIQAIYDEYGTSMTGGCLPTLIQFPIILALYRVIQNIPAYVTNVYNMYAPLAQSVIDVKGKKAQGFMETFVNDNSISAASYAMKQFKSVSEVGVDNIINLLSKFGVSNLNDLADTLGVAGQQDIVSNIDKIDKIHNFFLGINISEAPGWKLSWALIIPIISTLANFLSMKVTSARTNTDPSNDTANSMMKSMQYTMPVMSFLMTITLPAAIGIYWAASALISLVIMLVINYYYDHTDLDKLIADQKEKAAKKLEKNGGKRKKSFMERMMDTSEQAQEELEKKQNIRNNSASNLKNYVPSEQAQKAAEERKNKKYKEGSLGAKANIMQNYNNDNK